VRNSPLCEKETFQLAEQLMNIVARVGEYLDNGQKVSDVRAKLKESLTQIDQVNSLTVYKILVNIISKPVAVDPTPRNAYYINEIADVLDDAKFIYMVRDPRDCILSQKQKWRNYFYNKKRYFEALRLWVNYNPFLMAKFWKNSLASLNSAESSGIKDRLLVVRYEELTEQPELKVDELFQFLALDNTLPDLSFIRKGNNQKWKTKLPASHVLAIEYEVKNELEKLGYEITYKMSYKNILKVHLLKGLYFCKIPLALILNLGRIKNISNIIKKRVLGIK
jgi:hypothetical protein